MPGERLLLVDSGLGLAIVHSVVAAHGGRVELASSPGGGTTVRVHLPLSRQTRSPAS